MTRDDEFIGQLEGYLDEYVGLTPLPNPVRDAVRAALPTTKQTGSMQSLRRYITMSIPKPAQYALTTAAAAVVVIAAVAFNLLPGSPPPGGEPIETPRPTITPAVTPEPTPDPTAAGGGLPLGPHSLTKIGPFFEVGMTVTIGAPDWVGNLGGGFLIKRDNGDPPDGAGMVVFTGQLEVYGDPCEWATTRPDPMTGATVDDVIVALAAQSGRNATEPVDITVDGYTGKSIILSVPTDANFADCDIGQFRSWGGRDRSSRYHQGPGQIDQVWVIDVDGTLVTIDGSWYEGTPDSDRAELDAILDSMVFD